MHGAVMVVLNYYLSECMHLYVNVCVCSKIPRAGVSAVAGAEKY